MKFYTKTILSLLLLTALISGSAAGQNSIFFNNANGTQSTYALANVRKLNFTAEALNLHLTDGTVYSWNLNTISYYKYKNESTTGIDGLLEQANEWNVSIFPNPASGIQSLKMNLPKPSAFTLTLMDATGRCVHQQNLGKLEKGEQLIPLDLSAYPAGFFTLLLQSEHFSITKKLVKN